MNETEVVALMESATSDDDWNRKVDEVRRRCGGYPEFWYSAVIASGLGNRTAARCPMNPPQQCGTGGLVNRPLWLL